MTSLVIRGDARCLPLPRSSVDLIVTSPPYFALRSYTDGGEHYSGQVGDEATPHDFLDSMLACTSEWLRVLKPSGSLWVNLGDKYAGSNGQPGGSSSSTLVGTTSHTRGMADSKRPPVTDVRNKSLIGVPWRYALRCIDELGLILRAEVIWSKPNGLPESVTDRVRRSHEQWFHFTKEPRYFSAVDEIREAGSQTPGAVAWRRIRRPGLGAYAPGDRNDAASIGGPDNPLGKLPGSVWTVPTQPLTVPASLGVDHFAAFPMEWPRRIIRGWSPSGICVECGEGRRPVVTSTKVTSRPGNNVYDQRMPGRHASGNQGREGRAGDYDVRMVGQACACPLPDAPTRPAVVLDPFGGTGTTALVASTLGRVGISVDLSHDYSRLARWRTTDPGQRAAAMQVEKPPQQLAGQGDLFGEDVA